MAAPLQHSPSTSSFLEIPAEDGHQSEHSHAQSHPMTTWRPKRSVEECERLLKAPGTMFEMDHAIVNGRILRVYKNLPQNVREFWLNTSKEWADREYVVYENERFTYGQIREKSLKLAAYLYVRCGVRKGDRVAILMRNYPEYLTILWASQLLGAVTTFMNAWAPPPTLKHCIHLTEPRVLFVDSERADRLATGGLLGEMKMQTKLGRVFVVRERKGAEARWKWREMESLEDTLERSKAPTLVFDSPSPDPASSSSASSTTEEHASDSSSSPALSSHGLPTSRTVRIHDDLSPDSNATIFFTSGTTGLPKGVLSSQRAFLTNILNAFASKGRDLLRNGEDLPEPGTKVEEEQRCHLLSVPMFHVTGLTSTVLIMTALGGKIVLIRKWDKDEAARLIIRERVTNAGGVPSMAMDLLESDILSSKPGILEGLSFGGAPPAKTLPADIDKRFKGAVATGQGYGLSETNAIAASISGGDFLLRPDSTGLAAPVNDLIIVDPETCRVLPPGQVGELWIKGANVMTEYYRDKEATRKAITKDGWFRSGDLATMDSEGFLFIKDRYKDMIIRGGENIHSTEVENALYEDVRLHDAAAVSVPDKRLGELVAAVVATKYAYKGMVTEESVIEHAKTLLPAHAVPVMVLVQDEMIERNANGKITKTELRKRVRKEWARRLRLRERCRTDSSTASTAKAKAKL